MITAHESVPLVVKAVRIGAFDYLVKPVDPNQLILSLSHALERQQMYSLIELRSDPLKGDTLIDTKSFEKIISSDEHMLRLLHESELHAKSNIPILITGETGVGKELLARAIHDTSAVSNGPFVPVNMLSLSASLFESEFFGHVKGAFTGAISDKQGYLRQAKGGTLFLDEIGDLPMEIQGKLLRILQEGEFIPVGKTRAEKADVRFVAATNLNLAELVEKGEFRRDLYFRLRFANLHLPPLRERRGDIRTLALFFINKSSHPNVTLGDASASALIRHDWPGNIRELKGVIEAAANLAEGGEIEPTHLNIPQSSSIVSSGVSEYTAHDIEPMTEVERRHILRAYEALENNKTHTAKALGISLASLHRKLKAYGVR